MKASYSEVKGIYEAKISESVLTDIPQNCFLAMINKFTVFK